MTITMRILSTISLGLTLCCAEPPAATEKTTATEAHSEKEATPEKESAPKAPDKDPTIHPITAIVGATLFDGTGAEPVKDAVVVFEKDRITAAGPASEVEVPPGAHRVDAAGKWLVPGLIDAHIHFFQSGGLYTRPDIVDLRHVRSYESETEGIEGRLEDTFRRWLVSGVTSVVDMGGPFWNYRVRDKANKTLMAPRVAVSGPLVSTVPRPQMDIGDPPIIEAPTTEDARALVRKQLKEKTDLIKVWFIVSEEKGVGATIDMLKAVCDESHKGGVRVAVHATEVESARAAVEAGADIIVHSIHDAAMDDELIALMKEKDVVLTPTLAVMEGYAEILGNAPETMDFEDKYGNPEMMTSWGEIVAASGGPPKQAEARKKKFAARTPIMNANLMKLIEAGIPIAAGTDAGNVGTLHGATFHRELQLMAEAGMTPRQVLVSATANAARIFAVEPEVGTVEAGKLADMLLLEDNPLENVANLQKIHRVVKGGAVMAPSQILSPNPAWVVQKQVDAYNSRDLDEFVSWFSKDVVIKRHPSGETIAEGHGDLRKTYSSLFEKSPDLNCRITSRMVHGDWVVDHELVSGIKDRPYVRAVAMYRVEEGLIQEVWFLPKR